MTAVPKGERTWQLLGLLADGRFRSGQALASQLGVSRATVFNALANLSEYGVTLQRIRGRGYRLSRPWERLDKAEILRWLGMDAKKFEVELLLQAPSSNTLLLQRAGKIDAAAQARSGSVLAVELQSAGRGRLGRTWHSALGSSLTFSLLWRFDRGLNALAGLSLVSGVAILRALTSLGARGVKLKWPNDIVTAKGKLGGILIETQGDMLGPSAVVIGIGLNCALPATLAPLIGRPASSLEDACSVMPTRNRLLAVLLHELGRALEQYARDGFPAFRLEWEKHHIHQGRTIQLRIADGSVITGIMRGVDGNGMLLLESQHAVQAFSSGEIQDT
jgi:BirA family biotin operon repressor/biotin-[acetyl-CoA-carboxylase] ligase